MKNVIVLLLLMCFATATPPAYAAFVIKKKVQESVPGIVKAPKEYQHTETSNVTAPSHEAIAKAVDEFRDLPRAERRERVREAKDAFIRFGNTEHRSDDISTLLLVIIAILLPPLAVALFDHGITSRFWIDLLLTLLFYIPGLVYALIVILS